MARENNESALGAKLRKDQSEPALSPTPRSGPSNCCDEQKQPPLITKDELPGVDNELNVHEISGNLRLSLAGRQFNN